MQPNETAPIELDTYKKGKGPIYSVCTLVTNLDEYSEMLTSFRAAGFTHANSEFIYADNTGLNKYDGFSAVNKFLSVAQGDYVIICHQDIRLHADKIDVLERAIAELSAHDPNWGILGNAGGISPGRLAIRITDPNGVNTHWGNLPARVFSLDENFMVIRREANLAASRDIGGFHLYGTDLCIIADILGYSAYVIDFHLLHLGGASSKDAKSGDKKVKTFIQDYTHSKDRVIRKYRRAFATRWIQNTGTLLLLSHSRLLGLLSKLSLVRSAIKRLSLIQQDSAIDKKKRGQ